jgi:tetratricopeptide (TPR) repeat protein
VSPFEDNKLATDLTDRALSKSPGNAKAHWVKGQAAYASKGFALILSGRVRQALSPIQLALRISPRDNYAYFWHERLCRAYLHLQEYKDAIEECRRSVNMNSSQSEAYIGLVSAYGATGQMEQARQTIAALNKMRPIFTLRGYRQFSYTFSSNAQYRREVDDVVDGLRKAGIPEQ